MNEQEFIAALKDHEGIIHKVCNMYQQDISLHEDLFQEIVYNAWKGIGSFRGDARFSTWLYRVALNTAISFYRRGKRDRLAESHIGMETHFDPGNQSADPLQTLYHAIGELSRVDKALVMLYLEDYNYDEMSQLLGISPNLVAVRMSRIREKLRKIITHLKLQE